MHCWPFVLLAVVLSPESSAQSTLTREVVDGALLSKADPAATFVFDKSFRYVGGQAIDVMNDVRVRPHYFTMDDRPGSDSKAAETFLRAKGLELDGAFVTLRLFHLPDATRRRELMIIYGEALPAGASEQSARSAITARAQANVRVR